MGNTNSTNQNTNNYGKQLIWFIFLIHLQNKNIYFVYTYIYIKDELNNYEKLISMGFDDKLSWIASKKYKHIQNCIEFITKYSKNNDDDNKTQNNKLYDNTIDNKSIDIKLKENKSTISHHV